MRSYAQPRHPNPIAHQKLRPRARPARRGPGSPPGGDLRLSRPERRRENHHHPLAVRRCDILRFDVDRLSFPLPWPGQDGLTIDNQSYAWESTVISCARKTGVDTFLIWHYHLTCMDTRLRKSQRLPVRSSPCG